MGKKNKAELDRREKEKALKDVCLHCAFFKIHQDKWPDWKHNGDNQTDDAFNDLMRSLIKITAEVFLMIDRDNQYTFFHHVVNTYQQMETESAESAESDEATKH